MQPVKCSAPDCNNTRNFKLISEISKFGDWQKIRIQENAAAANAAAVPRSIDVIAR